MKCDRCGIDVDEKLILCPSCGNILHKEEKEEEKKETSANPFCSVGNGEEKKNIEAFIPKPTIVDKKMSDLYFNVPFHLTNLIYAILITLTTVMIFKPLMFLWLYKILGYGSGNIIAYINGVLIGNIFFALIFAPFFYKCDIPFWVAYIPGINVLVYNVNALQGEGKAVKNAILAYMASMIIARVASIPSVKETALFGLLSIIDMILLIFLVAECIHLGLCIARNYKDRFGYKSGLVTVAFFLFPLIMIPVVDLSKNRKYQY